MKYFLYSATAGILLLQSCLGVDPDLITDQYSYPPNVSIPMGSSLVQFKKIDDLPISSPPSEEPVSFSVSETLYFELQNTFDSPKYIQHVTLHFNTVNQYPADVSVKLTYLAPDGNPADLTVNQPINIPGAVMDDTGKIINFSSDVTDIVLTPAAIEGLLSVGELTVTTTVKDMVLSPNVIENLPNYFIKTSIGVRVQLLIEND